MTKRSKVAIYARISQDRAGTALGTKRQVQDCRAEADRRGWTVAAEYVDNDVSAYSGKRRPEYERMLSDITVGEIDAVIVYHQDRLHRRPIELEEFTEVCERAGLTDLVTLQQEIHIGGESDMLMARVMGAFAAQESAAKSRRQKRKMQEVAEAGRPHLGGRNRPYGFTPDRITHDPAEAAIIRALADRALAGESLASMTRWLNQEGIPTVAGNAWVPTTLRDLLKNPRLWGMRTHKGKVVGAGVWEPIISPEKGERLRQLLTDPARRTNRTARNYLLSGMCRCAVCGETMISGRTGGRRLYRCRTDQAGRGCGGPSISADMLEDWISEAVLYRLDSPELFAALTERAADDAEIGALVEQIANDQARTEELAIMWADGDLTREEWNTARQRLADRIQTATQDLARAGNRGALDQFIGHGEDLRARWDALNLSRQVAVVKAVLDHVTIRPAIQMGLKGLDERRVTPVWRA